MPRKLEGKVALVSGAGRGIGRAIALKLASEGARVVLNDIDEAPCAAVAAEIVAGGGEADQVPGSVTDQNFPQRFVQSALTRFGGLDIIVNNAGYTWDATIQNTTDAQFQAMVDVHLTAPFRLLRAAADPIRDMSRREAAEGREVFRKVVNISSISGLHGNAGQAGYSSGKAAILGLTRTLCKEWGRYKVNVNAVAFGLIDTRLVQSNAEVDASIEIEGCVIRVGLRPETLETFEGIIPLGRRGTPSEAAGSVFLLCTPESDYISGQVLVCGGGLLI